MSEHKLRKRKRLTKNEKRAELERGWKFYPAIMNGVKGQLVSASDKKREETGDAYEWKVTPDATDHKELLKAMKIMPLAWPQNEEERRSVRNKRKAERRAQK